MAAPDFDALASAITIAAGRVSDVDGAYSLAQIRGLLAGDLAGAWFEADAPRPLSCYFCDRPAVTIEAGYATCEPMFHDSQRRRLEDVPDRITIAQARAIVAEADRSYVPPSGETRPAGIGPVQWRILSEFARNYRVGRSVLAAAVSEGWQIIPPDLSPSYSAPDWTADERHRHIIGGQTWEHAHEGGHEAHSAVSHDLSGADLIVMVDDEPLPPYIWPAPDGRGWVDAWNGWYATEAEAREGGAGGGRRLWVLKPGEGIITDDEADERRAAMVALGAEHTHAGGIA